MSTMAWTTGKGAIMITKGRKTKMTNVNTRLMDWFITLH